MVKFSVASVERQERLQPNGRTKQVYRVWIETENGSTAAYDVPAGIYESDELKPYLQKQADTLDRAFLLSSE